MQDNPNTDTDYAREYPLDAIDWEIAFEPYEENPGAALLLGCHLMVLKSRLANPPYKVKETTQAIERAVQVLFPFTDFAEVSFDLFIKLAEGKLTFEEEQMLHALGIEF